MLEFIWGTGWSKKESFGSDARDFRETSISHEGKEVMLRQKRSCVIIDADGPEVNDCTVYLDDREALLATAMACLRALAAIDEKGAAK